MTSADDRTDRPEYLDSRPTVEVADLPAALAFLNDVAGLDTEVVMGEPPMFAIVASGAARMGVVEVASPALPEGVPCYFTLTGLDALIERIEAAGLTLTEPPTTRPWGIRDIVLPCPGGGPLLAFGEPVTP
jgi:predicted enzyme related to lactoylglutathione lyase